MKLPPCPRCQRPIPTDLVRADADQAPCPACGASHRVPAPAVAAEQAAAHRAAHQQTRAAASAEPPAGAWRRHEADRLHLGATHRSVGSALGFFVTALFWNGIVAFFVTFAVVGTLRYFGVPLPASTDGVKFEEGSVPSGGGLILLWLFLTPFIFIGATMIWAFLHALAGRTEICLSPTRGTIFGGVGPLGRTHPFDPASIRAVRLEQHANPLRRNRRPTSYVVLKREGEKDLRFGGQLDDTRRAFLHAALRDLLEPPTGATPPRLP
jgi:hypothetical protein